MFIVDFVSNITPIMQILHDSGFYAFMPQFMSVVNPNPVTMKDVYSKFKER